MGTIQRYNRQLCINAINMHINNATDCTAQAVNNDTDIRVDFAPLSVTVIGELTVQDVSDCIENLFQHFFVNSGVFLDILETFPECYKDIKDFFYYSDKLEELEKSKPSKEMQNQQLNAAELYTIAKYAENCTAWTLNNDTEMNVDFAPLAVTVSGELTAHDVKICTENLLNHFFTNSSTLLDVLKTFPESYAEVKEYFFCLDKLKEIENIFYPKRKRKFASNR